MSTTDGIDRRTSSRRSAAAVLVSVLSIVVVGPSIGAAAGCAPLPGGDARTLTIVEAWPSRGPAAHDHAAMILVRVDGRVTFRTFAPLAEKSDYSSM
ncbi:MAG TPA: hypothetical protein VGI72_05865 [Gaiellales bacterium]